MELVIKNISTNENPEPDGFTSKFYHTFKELTLIILQLFQKIENREHFLTHPIKPVLPHYQSQTKT